MSPRCLLPPDSRLSNVPRRAPEPGEAGDQVPGHGGGGAVLARLLHGGQRHTGLRQTLRRHLRVSCGLPRSMAPGVGRGRGAPSDGWTGEGLLGGWKVDQD